MKPLTIVWTGAVLITMLIIGLVVRDLLSESRAKQHEKEFIQEVERGVERLFDPADEESADEGPTDPFERRR